MSRKLNIGFLCIADCILISLSITTLIACPIFLIKGDISSCFVSAILFIALTGFRFAIMDAPDKKKSKISVEINSIGIVMLDSIKRKHNLNNRTEAIDWAISAATRLDKFPDIKDDDKKTAEEMTSEDWEREWREFVEDPDDPPSKPDN